jgi:hypothetical protein
MHFLSHDRPERAGRDADHAPATPFMLDGRKVTAFVLDDGARLAYQPGLAT